MSDGLTKNVVGTIDGFVDALGKLRSRVLDRENVPSKGEVFDLIYGLAAYLRRLKDLIPPYPQDDDEDEDELDNLYGAMTLHGLRAVDFEVMEEALSTLSVGASDETKRLAAAGLLAQVQMCRELLKGGQPMPDGHSH